MEKPQRKQLNSPADLDPKDRPLLEMQEWCRRHRHIIVLQSGLILTSDVHSRDVQNCKLLMSQRSLQVGKVVNATQELIDILHADAEAILFARTKQEDAFVSTQQQRLRSLVQEALKSQVSDIHIEVRANTARIRFRKHGELYVYAEWQAQLGREIASVAFNKETDHAIGHFNPSIPQNASMPLDVEGIEVRLRLASMPAHGGFDMVLRVLASGDLPIQSLAELGYLPEQIALIEKAIAMPYGAVIVSGPTGSGKTTTVASCMSMVNAYRKIYTIEDPVEKLISNATQIPVNTEKFDRDFASMGKATLRMDPDIIVLGEMRDEETTSVMVRAAVTGHLVFSTLHTNTATAIVPRLIDMGISRILLGDPNLLVCLICQRLVPILCQSCAKPLLESAEHQAGLARWQQVFDHQLSQLKVRGHHANCSDCQGLGISGRTVVAEVIWIDQTGREFIQQSDTLNWEKYLRGQGWKSYHEQALALTLQGKADILDVEKLIGPIGNHTDKSQFLYTA